MWVSVQLHAPASVLPENNPSTHWIGGRMGPGLDVLEYKISLSSTVKYPGLIR